MIRSISQIEITSRCSLRCKYCPQPKMARPKADMSDEVFERVLYWLQEFNQDVVNLHHFGESTMHPKFIEWLDMVSDIVPVVAVSSNGVGVTRQMIRDMKKAGLDNLGLSIHRPEVVQKVAEWCLDEGLPFNWASGPVSAPHNWAGQVTTVRNSAQAETFACQFLIDQSCIIFQDGRVGTCCIDAEGIVDLGTVWEDLRQIDLKPFRLCLTCHQQIPEELFPGWRQSVVEELELVH